RSRRARRAGSCAPPPRHCANAAAASPSVPVTHASSPARAPSRRRAAPGSTQPCTVTHTDSGPRVVSPPTSATPCALASARNPSRKPSSQPASASGSDSDRLAHAGVAPIAARSDRFTASAFQPMSAAGVPSGKCTPALRVSVAIASSMPAGGCSSAASSPMPRTTSSRAVARRRMWSMKVNSMAGRVAALAPLLQALFHGAPGGGGVVEHAVDVGVAVLGTEALGAVDGLIDHDPVRDVQAVAQLVGGDAQRGALDLVHLRDAAVDEFVQRGVQFGVVAEHAAHQVLEVLQVGDFARLLVRELRDHLLRAAAGHLPGVHRLQRAPAGARARDLVDAVAGLPPHAGAPGSRESNCAISIATCAASSPLLPWLPPARFSASAWSSTASTPLQTGTPVSSATF